MTGIYIIVQPLDKQQACPQPLSLHLSSCGKMGVVLRYVLARLLGGLKNLRRVMAFMAYMWLAVGAIFKSLVNNVPAKIFIYRTGQTQPFRFPEAL